MLKITLIAATLFAASTASFAQTAATPVPAKPVTVTAPVAAAAPAKLATPAAAPAADGAPAVKKSNNNICHDATSSGYKATKNFKPFASMDECIKSGGRAPKSDTKAKK